MPGEDIPLRIFEPRYLQLIDEAKSEGFTFVIPFVHEDDMTHLGCEVKLQQVVAESEQGRKVITVESIGLVKIVSHTEQMTGKLYPGGQIQRIQDPGYVRSMHLKNLVIEHAEHIEDQIAEKWISGPIPYSELMGTLNLSSDDKFHFATIQEDTQREAFLIRQIEYLNLIRRQEQMLNNDFRLN